MSRPNVLTQILSAVQSVDAKVEALETQLVQLDARLQPLENLPAQLTDIDAKVTDIQDILVGEAPPAPGPESGLEHESRRGSRRTK